MRLHQRGIDLLLDVQDALDHLGGLSTEETQRILKEIAEVLRDLLARDVPVPDDN